MRCDFVFEGGGAKGMVFVGAQKELERHSLRPRRVVGTSAGAITATLLAAGYTADEMRDALGEQENGKPVFATFMDAPEEEDFTEEDIDDSLTMNLFEEVDVPFVPGWVQEKIDKRIIAQLMKLPIYRMLFSFIERGGLYAGNAFLAWFKRKLDEKQPGLAGLTMAQFAQVTESDLSVVASDTTGKRMLVLNHRTAPNCPVAWAVRMSMSIPFAWHEVRWRAEWDPYIFLDPHGGDDGVRAHSLAGHIIVDGGALSNFPIDLLTSKAPHVRAVMGDTDPAGAPTIGLLIDETLPVEGAPPPPADDDEETGIVDDVKRLRTVSRVTRLMNTMMAAHDSRLIRTSEHLICRLPAETYGTMEFDMTEERRATLIAAGAAAMRAHLDGRPELAIAQGIST